MINKPFCRIYRPFTEAVMRSNVGLDYMEDERYCSERVQLIRMYKMLQAQVIDTFQYIEPVENNKDAYSLRYHQLYWSICAEIETNFRGILKANGYTRGDEKCWNIRSDFFKTNSALRLNGYELKSHYYEIQNCIDASRPFSAWSSMSSYTALAWYQEHNAVKHYRSQNFNNANLKNVVTALGGLYILLFSQFGDLVDLTTNEGATVFFVDDEPMFFGVNNKMGYNLKQKPSFSESEKYGFEWNLIKANSDSFQKFPF